MYFSVIFQRGRIFCLGLEFGVGQEEELGAFFFLGGGILDGWCFGGGILDGWCYTCCCLNKDLIEFFETALW